MWRAENEDAASGGAVVRWIEMTKSEIRMTKFK